MLPTSSQKYHGGLQENITVQKWLLEIWKQSGRGVKRRKGRWIWPRYIMRAQKCHNEHLYLVYLIYANKNSLSLLTKFNGEQPGWGVVLFLGRCSNTGCFHYLTWIQAIIFLESKCHVLDFFFFIWGLSTMASWLRASMFYTI